MFYVVFHFNLICDVTDLRPLAVASGCGGPASVPAESSYRRRGAAADLP
jgi:hypothetical protein